MKRNFLALNVIIMTAVFVGNYHYILQGGLFLKILCSAGFALQGVVNLIYIVRSDIHGRGFQWWMAAGLIFSLLADSTIEGDFILGVLLFGAAHVCYIVAQCRLLRLNKKDAHISWLIFTGALVFLLLCPWLELPDYEMRSVCLVYGAVLSLMLGKAITDFVRSPGQLTGMLALGSALFFFSDAMLVLQWFIHNWSITGMLCMATYYPGQCLLALSILLKENRCYEPLGYGIKVRTPKVPTKTKEN